MPSLRSIGIQPFVVAIRFIGWATTFGLGYAQHLILKQQGVLEKI